MFLSALMCFSLIITTQTSSEDDTLSTIMDAVGGIMPGDGNIDSEEVSKEIKKYYNYIANVEEKYYKDIFSKHISQEEKDQVKYFQKLLQHLKTMNKAE